MPGPLRGEEAEEDGVAPLRSERHCLPLYAPVGETEAWGESRLLLVPISVCSMTLSSMRGPNASPSKAATARDARLFRSCVPSSQLPNPLPGMADHPLSRRADELPVNFGQQGERCREQSPRVNALRPPRGSGELPRSSAAPRPTAPNGRAAVGWKRGEGGRRPRERQFGGRARSRRPGEG